MVDLERLERTDTVWLFPVEVAVADKANMAGEVDSDKGYHLE